MKKNINILICLAAMTAVSGCKDYYDEYPSFEELQVATGTVESRIGISVGREAFSTRMSDAAVQSGQDLASFRGINELYLLPFRTSSSDATAPVTASLSCLGPVIGASNSIGEQATDLEDNFYKYYNNVVIPYGTNAFLCYGSGPSTDPKTDGKVVAQNITSSNLSDIKFSLQSIATVDQVTAESSIGQLLVNYLNSIYVAGNGWETSILSSVKDILFAENAYTAGSSANVLAMVKKLHKALYFARNSSDVAPVITAITEKVNTSGNEVTGWKSDSGLDGYPGNLNLPDGAAYISWNATDKKYEIVTDKSNSSAMAVYSVENVVYPPSLYYYTNSLIHTSTVKVGTEAGQRTPESIFVTDHSAGWQKNETDIDDAYVLNQPLASGSTEFLFKANGMVDYGTTVVAVTKPLQYSVARFDFALRNNGTISDGNLVLADANGDKIAVNANSFPVTGILIAGQKDVDWQFQPVTAAEAPEYTIYDSQVSAYLPNNTTTPTAVMHTLAFETAASKKVYVAVEFQNNSGRDFVTGADKRIVADGCKFYLIGVLDPTDTASDGTAKNVIDDKVFLQDHVTAVALTVSTLANAYNVIPDFSGDQLEFSLGVLDWKLSTPACVSLE